MATPEASPRPDMSARASISALSSPPAPNSDLGSSARLCSASVFISSCRKETFKVVDLR